MVYVQSDQWKSVGPSSFDHNMLAVAGRGATDTFPRLHGECKISPQQDGGANSTDPASEGLHTPPLIFFAAAEATHWGDNRTKLDIWIIYTILGYGINNTISIFNLYLLKYHNYHQLRLNFTKLKGKSTNWHIKGEVLRLLQKMAIDIGREFAPPLRGQNKEKSQICWETFVCCQRWRYQPASWGGGAKCIHCIHWLQRLPCKGGNLLNRISTFPKDTTTRSWGIRGSDQRLFEQGMTPFTSWTTSVVFTQVNSTERYTI